MTAPAAVPFDLPNTALLPVPGAVLMGYQQRWAADAERLQIREKPRCAGISRARRKAEPPAA